MTDQQKLEILKDKFQQIIQASVQQDPKADTIFLAFFNAVKDNDELFATLVEDAKASMQANIDKMQTAISSHEAKIAELDTVKIAKAKK